jgi:hypothetical protein
MAQELLLARGLRRNHEKDRPAPWRVSVAALAVVATLALPSVRAQIPDVPDWIGLPLTLQMDVASWSDPAYAQEELPGLGHKFELLFAMMDDDDPENPTNDTISNVTTPAIPAGFGLAFRNLPPGIKITALDTQLGFKYYFVDRSCGGGSPRVTLLVDADGDRDFDQSSGDFAAHGHPNPFAGCPPETWVYENLTDNGPRWEVTPGGAVMGIPAFPFSTWDTLEAASRHSSRTTACSQGSSWTIPAPSTYQHVGWRIMTS